jgi:hypothetical protein
MEACKSNQISYYSDMSRDSQNPQPLQRVECYGKHWLALICKFLMTELINLQSSIKEIVEKRTEKNPPKVDIVDEKLS